MKAANGLLTSDFTAEETVFYTDVRCQRDLQVVGAANCSSIQATDIECEGQVVAESFRSRKFRMISTEDGGCRVQRLDDDGALVSDGWQTVVQFRWDDLLGGSLNTNILKGNGANEVTIADNCVVERDLRVTGNFPVMGTCPRHFGAGGTSARLGRL
jgi:hypothetical protein